MKLKYEVVKVNKSCALAADPSPILLCVLFAAYTVPSRKRRATVMDQVSSLVTATVAQLREMDAAMQAQEDARLQRLMSHEREMQNTLMSQLVVMNERISRENHERNLELVDRILSRFPSPSSSHWLDLMRVLCLWLQQSVIWACGNTFESARRWPVPKPTLVLLKFF